MNGPFDSEDMGAIIADMRDEIEIAKKRGEMFVTLGLSCSEAEALLQTFEDASKAVTQALVSVHDRILAGIKPAVDESADPEQTAYEHGRVDAAALVRTMIGEDNG